MSAGDQYNAYRNDVIDSYEKERTTEHRGTKLGDAYDDQTPGIFNNNILITRIELANGLTFKDTFSYEEDGTPKTEANFLNVLFDGYGTYTAGTTKPKAIRVWSGNDHWLLTKESACKYLYILPIDSTVTNSTCFDLIYWNGTFNELFIAINYGNILKQGHAFLYHDGSTSSSGGGNSTVTQIVNQDRSSSSDDLISFDSAVAPKDTTVNIQTEPGKKDEDLISFVQEPTTSNDEDFDTTNESITLNQVWENIDDVYLIKAPIHQHFALSPDDKRLPFYGGTYRIVYKNGETQDIPTFSTLTYFYSMQEVRTCQIPTVTNPKDFDWFSHEEEQYRHIPMVIVRPSNPETRIRVLDSSDASSFTSIDVIPDIYYAELNSKKICSFQVEEGFTVLEEPTKKELDFTDKVFDISGFKVLYKDTTKSKNVQYSADSGTLYVKNQDITDDEYTFGNEKMAISREVYAKNEDDASEKLVTTLSYPVSEATLVDVVAGSGVSIPDTTESSTISDTEGALVVSKAQESLGANEEQSIEATSLFSLKYHYQNDLDAISFSRLKKKTGAWFQRKWKELREKRKKLQEEARQKIKLASMQAVQSIVDRIKKDITTTTLNAMALGETVEVKTSICRYMVATHIVPPVPQNVKTKYQNTLGVIPWPLLLKAGKFILPFAMRGIKWLVRKIKKKSLGIHRKNVQSIAHGYTEDGIPYVFEETNEWRDSPVKGVCADAVIIGYNESTNEDTETLPLKINAQGQSFNIVLHNPSTVSSLSAEAQAKVLIGIRQSVPPATNQIGYGQQVGTSTTGNDVGTWVGIASDNTDVPLNFTLENYSLVCPAIKWSNDVSTGTVEQEVQVSTTGLQKLKALGYTIAPHLVAANNGVEGGALKGVFNWINRGRQFIEGHPRLMDLTKRGVSWTIGKIFQRQNPLTNIEMPTKNLLLDDDTPVEEVGVITDTPLSNVVNIDTSNDSTVDDENFVKVVAVSFEGDYPTRKDITLNNLENFFKTSKVSLLYDDDEEVTRYIGTGLHRTYLDDGEFVPSSNLSRDLLEFGRSIVTIRGISFSMGADLLNYDTYPSNRLVLTQQPERLVYTFGDKRLDFTGATFNLTDSTGKILIAGLTEENLIVEDLPTNIEECQLEIPSNEDDKTIIQSHFFGYTNNELKVTLLHPYIVAMEESNQLNGITKATAYSLHAMKGFKAPVLRCCTRIWGTSGENATWPTSTYKLMVALNTKLVLRDTMMRRKVFAVGTDISESLFNKIYTITGYNSSSTATIQQITISVLGHTTKKWISLEAVGCVDEEDMTSSTISSSIVKTTPPEDWDGTTPDGSSQATAYGSEVCLEENTSDPIMASCRRIIMEMRGSTDVERIIPNYSLLTTGTSKIASLYSASIDPENLLSTGFRHHRVNALNKGFFKKLWKKIKKAAKWVYKKVIKPVGKFVGNAVKTVAETVISTAAGALGSLTGGAVGGEGEEYTPDPTQAIYMKPAELLGSNGEVLLTPITRASADGLITNIKGLPWRPIVERTYTASGGGTKLARIFGSLRKFAGGFIHRNAASIPGLTSFLVSRRLTNGQDAFPSKMADSTNSSNEDSVFFDAIDMVGMNTYDENVEYLTNSSNISSMDFYPYTWNFSSAELVLGDTWPSLEELQQMVMVYAERSTDLKWVAIPLTHSAVTIYNYSDSDSNTEQLVTIQIKTSLNTFTTYAIFYRSSSNLKLTLPSDQYYVWLLQHPYAPGGSFIAYLGERRHETQRTSDTDYVGFNYKDADTIKYVDVDNRKILSIHDYEDHAESMIWNDSGSTIRGFFNIVSLKDGSSQGYMLYSFKYTSVSNDVTEIKLYRDSEELYVSKDGILYRYDGDQGGMVITGYDPNSEQTTATIHKYVKIVDEFSS